VQAAGRGGRFFSERTGRLRGSIDPLSECVLALSRQVDVLCEHVAFRALTATLRAGVQSPAEFIGAGNAFMKYLRARFDYVDKTNQIMYQRLAKIHLRTALLNSGHPHVFMKMYHGDALVGKVSRAQRVRDSEGRVAFGIAQADAAVCSSGTNGQSVRSDGVWEDASPPRRILE
jgi:hypothetical protein